MADNQQYQSAVDWALKQEVMDEPEGVIIKIEGDEGVINESLLVVKVREYFNENNIEYSTFSYIDLEPYLLD